MSAATPVKPSVVLPSDQVNGGGRVVSIDILRGLAILWVIAYHIWEDVQLPQGDAASVYTNFRDPLLDSKILPSLTSFGEMIVGQGYLGVPLFMMLSGLSLTMNAYRRPEPSLLGGYLSRFRRVVSVYWAGIVILVATVAVVALLQMLMDGGSYEHQWFNVRTALFAPMNIQWDDVLWAFTVVPPIFRDKNDPVALTTMPIISLWFVPLLLQYYLVFPFALRLLKRVGPFPFVLAGLAATLATRAAYIHWSGDSLQVSDAARYLRDLAPLRFSEFFIGMGLGYLIANRRELVAGWLQSPFDIAGVLVLGCVLVMSGVVLTPEGDWQLVLSSLLVQLGLALAILPLLFKPPGHLEATMVARALVFLGVVSFTALIVSDAMRVFASFLRLEGVPGAVWWFFLCAVYVPGSTLLAYPLARLFGLLPQQRGAERAPARASAIATPARPGRSSAKRRRGTPGRSAVVK